MADGDMGGCVGKHRGTRDVAVIVQYAASRRGVPSAASFRRWVEQTLAGRRTEGEVVVRVVDEAESASLNQRYRGKSGPTNVLSFPFEAPPGVPTAMLGDLVICAPVVEREARGQHKPVRAHWAHMVVHGTLHLLGYEHQKPEETKQMESLEITILDGLGFPDPYDGPLSNHGQGV